MSRAELPADLAPATRVLRAGAPLPSTAGVEPLSGADALPGTSTRPTACAADLHRDDLSGLRLGPYDLGSKIGSGGMGKVFRARHRGLDREFAVKFVAADIACHTDAQRRFEQEARALGQLQHPHIVNAVDAGCANGLMYLVTELIDGEDLGQLVLRRGPLPAPEACEFARQAALGLAHSHATGFVHRDIKPSNLIVDRNGTVKVLDFGLVHGGQVEGSLTEAGVTLGTWDFLAPEQAHDSRQVDPRSDLYGLGCTLIYLLSGCVPFGQERYASPAAKVKGHLFDAPSWLQQPPAHVPAELLAVLKKMVEKSPADRFQTAQAVAAELAPFAALEGALAPAVAGTARRRIRRAVSGLAAACLVAAFVCLTYWPSPQLPLDGPTEGEGVGEVRQSASSTDAAQPATPRQDRTPVTADTKPTQSVPPPRFSISR